MDLHEDDPPRPARMEQGDLRLEPFQRPLPLQRRAGRRVPSPFHGRRGGGGPAPLPGLGIDTYETSASERAWMSSGASASRRPPLDFIGSTRIDETSETKSHAQKLQFLIERRRSGASSTPSTWRCSGRATRSPASTGCWTRSMPPVAVRHLGPSGRHRGAMREARVRHRHLPFPLNLTGFVDPGYKGTETPVRRGGTRPQRGEALHLMKTLGARRLPPAEGLQFVAENSKPNDLISIGSAPWTNWRRLSRSPRRSSGRPSRCCQ